MTVEILIIFLLLLANGVFAAAEMAIVASRKARLRQLSEAGNTSAQAALELAESPNRFLPTVQVGITLVGVLAGAYGGATVAQKIAAALEAVPVLAPYGESIGVGLVVVGITFLSLVIGELVPKRLALNNPEATALILAKPMRLLSRFAAPVVKLLGNTTDAVLRLCRITLRTEPPISEEDVTLMVKEGARAGVFLQSASVMVGNVLGLDRIPVRDLMTPRAKIIWINIRDAHEVIWHKIVVSGHTNFPVYEGNRDNVVGLVSVKAIYANLAAGTVANTKDLMTPPLLVAATQMATALLETFQKRRQHIALVLDEFGGIVGLVTLHDVMEAVLGDFPSQDERCQPAARRREDGSWLVDGLLEADAFQQLVPEFPLPSGAERDYVTVAGYVIKEFGHVPTEGESFQRHGYHVEVIDMDGNRVDKVLLMPGKLRSTPQPVS